jgi:thiamine-monophosphate kinase
MAGRKPSARNRAPGKSDAQAEGNAHASGETHIIATYFAPLARDLPGAFNLEDDCAAITPPPGCDLVVKTDPIREGIHFPPDADAADIAWKALAVNVSDLAAKGATPLAYLLAVSFPEAPKPAWLKRFSSGLAEAQKAFGIVLAGGDTDRAPGPLSVAVTAFGSVPSGRMVRRAAAKPGDVVWVTGTLGDAALGLELVREPLVAMRLGLFSNHCDAVIARYDRPSPRLQARDLLLRHATAAMDLSDGLVKDAGRMSSAANVHIELARDLLPLSPAMRRAVERNPAYWSKVAAHGDDYEILFTAPAASTAAIRDEAKALPFAVTEIGTVSPGNGVTVRDATGATVTFDTAGWDHF